MKTIIGDTAFVIKFRYQRSALKVPTGESMCYLRVGPANQPGSTLCDIVLATTTNSKKAQFTYADGRLISFKKLLDTLFADKALMSQFKLKASHKRLFMTNFSEQCSRTFKVTSTEKYPHLWPTKKRKRRIKY